MIMRSIPWGFRVSIRVTLNSQAIYLLDISISKSENTIRTLVCNYEVDFVGFQDLDLSYPELLGYVPAWYIDFDIINHYLNTGK